MGGPESTNGTSATDVTRLTAWQCRELLMAGEVSAVELTTAYLDRISAVDGEVQAYLARMGQKSVP